MSHATDNTRENARTLLDSLDLAARLPVEVLYASVGQDGCVLTLATVEDAQLLADALFATPARFGWQARIGHRGRVIVEVTRRPEVHPHPIEDAT